MMTTNKMLIARAGATAIAAVLALSPTYAATPKPIVDLSKSPAVTGKAGPAQPAKQKAMIGPVDQQTAEIGGGAIVLLAFGAGAFALSRRRKRHNEEAWANEEAAADEPHDPLFDEPAFQHEPAPADAPAFAWDKPAERRSHGKTWVERAYRGPTPENPSLSLRTRLKRAAFFDKREREAAAGEAAPLDASAGLPEAVAEQSEREAA